MTWSPGRAAAPGRGLSSSRSASLTVERLLPKLPCQLGLGGPALALRAARGSGPAPIAASTLRYGGSSMSSGANLTSSVRLEQLRADQHAAGFPGARRRSRRACIAQQPSRRVSLVISRWPPRCCMAFERGVRGRAQAANRMHSPHRCRPRVCARRTPSHRYRKPPGVERGVHSRPCPASSRRCRSAGRPPALANVGRTTSSRPAMSSQLSPRRAHRS